eukprot:gene10728-biopygen1967
MVRGAGRNVAVSKAESTLFSASAFLNSFQQLWQYNPVTSLLLLRMYSSRTPHTFAAARETTQGCTAIRTCVAARETT